MNEPLHTTRKRSRSRLAALLFVLGLVAAACGSTESNTISLGEDTFAPAVEAGEVETAVQGESVDFAYGTFEGQTAAFSDIDGPVVLNFFASWCTLCVAELPDFETVSHDLADDVTFLGLATSDRPEDAAEMIERTGVTFQTGTDESGEIFNLFESISMPTTVFLDADHNVVKVHSGAMNAETLTETINTELLS